ncbi:hypothetical protein BN1058_00908 [Paraliobacillus sp. PM-2]|uniref:VrrA/YqfQ family protein n=1 Tax=Paraliobacillus sp. PM-2 TaxID=1462524 RepID=UPI00061C64F0|nr:VrrA/YqfQ family protein [Paraliobacillus sp. PM-2]CQR46639.1 hypothetical protein BN1058_00908 [Paraliobacillus sp. PM-2]
MFPPMQGRPPIQPNMPPMNMPPMNMQPLQHWGGMPAAYQPTTAVPKSGLQGMIQKLLPSQLGSQVSGATGGGVTQTLSNLQQILKMTQSVTPIIQQYGPLVKNLPSMLTLLKAFQEADGEEANEENSAEEIEESKEDPVDDVDDDIDDEQSVEAKIETENENIYLIETDQSYTNQPSGSKPKLYI